MLRSCLFFILSVSVVSCAKGGFSASIINDLSNDQSSQSPLEPLPAPPPGFQPLLWESARAEGALWSKFILGLLQNDANSIVEKSDDMKVFCPTYAHLSKTQRFNVAAMLVSAIAKFESDFDPLSRSTETNLGTDPVTGKQVVSEGLLQLSYQDTMGRSYCQFDWNADKNLGDKDPRKTILNPFKNLRCGLLILAEQVDRYGSLIIEQGNYWAVIRKNGKFQKIHEISQLVQTLTYCK